MIIQKMTATFGVLDNATLTPGEGLTVVAAPNETGKSTWAGFLRAMLYGIDTRERDKTGFLADKTRYQPWSGAPMAGEMQVEWQGKEITIRRFPTRTNPFGGFEAVYTATGDPVPGLTAANAGEQLTGVGREVYLRSAFVGQGGAAIGASRELEARVAALATSGQEDVSYSAVERTLKDWRNRRRANRAVGLIPQMEGELAGVDRTLREMDETRRRRADGLQELERLETKRKALQADLETWARIEKHELNRRYGEAHLEWEKAKEAVPEDRPHPVFGAMSGEEAWAFAQRKQKEWEHDQKEGEEYISELKSSLRRWRRGALSGGIVAVLMLALAAVMLWLQGTQPAVYFAIAAGLAAVYVWLNLRLIPPVRRRLEEIGSEYVPEDVDWLERAAEYREQLAKLAQARAVEAAARRRVDDLAAQGGQLFDTLEMLYPPAQSKAATAAQLSAVERELARIRGELARTDGILAHMGGPESLEDRRGGLDAQLSRRRAEYDALTTALDVLSAANDALRQRFSPALNQKAGELFAALTGGRWPRLTLARDFSAQAGAEGDTLPRPSLALSAGTAEQLYLAVRLAVCALTVPGAPIVLDDALAAFDDARMAMAMALLKGQGAERQILLFSCHGREAAWARANGIPVIHL